MLDMLPGCTTNDSRDGGLLALEPLRQLALSHAGVQTTNEKHLGFSQLGQAIALPSWHRFGVKAGPVTFSFCMLSRRKPANSRPFGMDSVRVLIPSWSRFGMQSRSISIARGHQSHLGSMLDVFSGGHSLKVAQDIVGLVPVDVIGLKGWVGINEGSTHQDLNIHSLTDTVFAEAHREVSAKQALLEHLARIRVSAVPSLFSPVPSC